MLNKLIAIILVSLVWFPACGHAATDVGSTGELGTPIFLFSAFGTAGVVHSSEDRADFTSSIFKPNGAGYTHPWSTDVDSILGAQIIANVTSRLSATVQVISQQRYDNTYTPYVNWANIKYQLTPDASLRLGRTVLPSFLYSDTRNVGYANPWVRPPIEVYGLVPVTNSDGVDASYRFHIGASTHTLVGTYGKISNQQPDGSSAEAKRQWNIADTVEYGPATVHLTYQEAHLTIDSLHEFFSAFRHFGPQGDAIADKYDQYARRLQFFSVGGTYDPGAWFVTGEWGTTEMHSALGESTAWYASGGYRLSKQFTPYLNYAQVRANSNRSDPGLDVSALPPVLAGPALGLNAGLDAILASIAVQSTTTLGLRWDFRKNVDLKLQYGHTRLGPGSPGMLINLQPGFQPGSALNVFSAAINFVM